MWIPASKILNYLPQSPQEGFCLSIRKQDGSACRTGEHWEVLALANAQYINGHVRGNRLTYVELTVPPNVAFAIFGERNLGRQRRVRQQRKISAWLNDANRTTVRQQLENHVVLAHHAAHCSAARAWEKPISRECL